MRNRMGGSVWSTIQKAHRINQLECLYASLMLSLRYYLCLFYTYYAYTKKKCYVVLCFSVSFIPPQRRMTIHAIGWEVRFGQHFRRYREFMSLKFLMLLLCYNYVVVYEDFTRIMLLQRSAKLHQVDKCVEVSNMFFLWQFFLTYKDYMLPLGSMSCYDSTFETV